MDIQKSFEILKNNFYIGLEVEERFYILMDAKNESILKKYESYKEQFELALESSNRIESYVQELNPLVYDIVEFSEKPMVLLLSGAKNISTLAMQEHQNINIRIVREGSMQTLIRKYRLPLILCLLKDEELTDFNTEHIITLPMQDAFMDASILKLEVNGRVEIIKK
jgi:L-threonylcarbamoyladenylate synthase